MAMLVAYAAFAASVFFRPSPGKNNWLDAGLYNLPFALAIVACFAQRGSDRIAWRVLGSGLALYTIANAYSTLAVDPEAAAPTLADVGWLAFYPLAYVAMVLFVRPRIARFQAGAWLDGAIAGLGGGALVAAFVLQPILAGSSGGTASVLTNLAYPTGDILLLILLTGFLVVCGGRIERALALLGVGFAVFAIGDSAYLFEAANGSYVEGGVLDLSWSAAAVAIGFAASLSPASATARANTPRLLVALPMLFSVVSISILSWAAFSAVPDPAIILAVAALALALLRLALAFRDLQGLALAHSQAHTDDLTGLPNRRRFRDELDRLVAKREVFSLLMLDLDRFKEINDALGHPVGDQLLVQVAERLVTVGTETTAAARLGGDEFALLVPGEIDAAVSIAHQLLTVFADPFPLGELAITATASTGIASFPRDASESIALLQHADAAMYQAKAERAGFRIYDESRDTHHSREQLRLTEELRHGIADQELIVHFQPRVSLTNGEIEAIEALVRWNHPSRGLVYPDSFLPLAEHAGLMGALTAAVLELALSECRGWRDAGHTIPVGVNLAASSLSDPSLHATVRALLRKHALPPSMLELEITEQAFTAQPSRAREAIAAFRESGVAIVIDDFGVAHASLGALRGLAVDNVKLDRSFADDLVADPGVAALARANIELAHAFGFRLVAEGVETQADLEMMRSFNCDAAQGYQLARPLPPEQLVDWLLARSQAAAA